MPRLNFALSSLALLAVIGTAAPDAVFAQSRTVPGVPDGPKAGGGPAGGGPGIPIPTLPIPTGPSRGDRTGDGQSPGGPTRGDPPKGGSADGLPDAVTVLEILRRLPHGPGIGPSSGSDTVPSTDSDGPPDRGPEPQTGRPAVPPDAPRFPNRVVTINPGQPFIPRPSPRGDGAPPPVTGAIVPDSRPREVIVTLGPGATANTVYELSQDLGLDGDTLYVSNLLGTRVVRLRIPDTRSVAGVVQQLSADARVQVAQPNYVFTANGAAAGKMLPQYAPQKLHLNEAHKIASGSIIKIAVIDTAIDASHPVFGGAITTAFDALGESKAEAELHGTHIAGIVAARTQLQGVAPQAQILGVRAFAK
ncbi:MAG: S8 family serine peptidase, partial [Hyphomicrobium sp.]